MTFPFNKVVTSENETAELAHDFMDVISKGDVIVLNGNLGSGKTFFIKKALEKLGINNTSSPTFAIVNEYSGGCKIYHFDLYRINRVRELFDIGFNDYLNNDQAITFIEWGEMFPELLPLKRIEVNIILNQDFTREFQFAKHE